jgi:hypothetical protein
MVAVLDDWTAQLIGDLAAVRLADLTRAPTIYRVLLLADALELDLSMTPAEHFRPAGPRFRLLFGQTSARPRRADDARGPVHPHAGRGRGHLRMGRHLCPAHPGVHRARPPLAGRAPPRCSTRPRPRSGLPASRPVPCAGPSVRRPRSPLSRTPGPPSSSPRRCGQPSRRACAHSWTRAANTMSPTLPSSPSASRSSADTVGRGYLGMPPLRARVRRGPGRRRSPPAHPRSGGRR